MCFCCGYWKIERKEEKESKTEVEQSTETMKPQYDKIPQ
jgi:hypothetical protein